MNPFGSDDPPSNPFASNNELSSSSKWGSSKPSVPSPASHSRTSSAAPKQSAYGKSAYDKPAYSSSSAYEKSSAPAPAYEKPATSSPSAYGGRTAMGASSSGGGGEYAKELELQRREAELKVREARLAEREKITGTFTPPNWPVCKPMVYHDIDKDIPAGGRWLVKRVYAGWWLAVIVYLANCIAAFSLLVTKVSTGGNMFGISLLILLVGTPVAFVFWYRPLYNGVRNGSSASFFVFWFNYGFHLGVAALLAVGIPGWGGVGVIITLQQFGKNVGVAVLCVIATVLMIFEVFYGLWQIKSANTYFKSSGMTTDSAKNEAAMTVLNSRAGREAVKTAAASELRRAI